MHPLLFSHPLCDFFILHPHFTLFSHPVTRNGRATPPHYLGLNGHMLLPPPPLCVATVWFPASGGVDPKMAPGEVPKIQSPHSTHACLDMGSFLFECPSVIVSSTHPLCHFLPSFPDSNFCKKKLTPIAVINTASGGAFLRGL